MHTKEKPFQSDHLTGLMIAKLEFMVTVHNCLWAKCTQLWPLSSCSWFIEAPAHEMLYCVLDDNMVKGWNISKLPRGTHYFGAQNCYNFCLGFGAKILRIVCPVYSYLPPWHPLNSFPGILINLKYEKFNRTIWRWPTYFTLVRHKTMRNTKQYTWRSDKRWKPMKFSLIFIIHWQTRWHIINRIYYVSLKKKKKKKKGYITRPMIIGRQQQLSDWIPWQLSICTFVFCLQYSLPYKDNFNISNQWYVNVSGMTFDICV